MGEQIASHIIKPSVRRGMVRHVLTRQGIIVLFIVVSILLLQLAVRAHAPSLKDPYLDEGFHLRRAMRIYDFEENPARYGHGKLLLYVWLGLFDTDDTTTILPTARLAMAIFSLISGAGIYLLGRMFHNELTGILALLLYALNPLAVFYERMAMADPLASGLMILVVWRSIIFARRPTLTQGVLLGALIALTTMAKLTMALAVLFPVLAIAIYWNNRHRMRQYIAPLVVSGVVFSIIWSPFALPAFLARNSDDPFVLVSTYNIVRTDDDPETPVDYLSAVIPQIEEYLGSGILLIIFAAWLLTLWQAPRHYLYVGLWLVAITILVVLLSRLDSTRYFMPIAAPLSLMVALIITRIRWRWLQGIALIPVGVWLLIWALPMIQITLTNPLEIPFTGTNATEHIRGYLIGDSAFREAAAVVNALETDEPIYAVWSTCHLIFFYIERPLDCLPDGRSNASLRRALRALSPDDTLLFIVSGYRPYWDDYDFATYEFSPAPITNASTVPFSYSA